jgi:hypothetical protein
VFRSCHEVIDISQRTKNFTKNVHCANLEPNNLILWIIDKHMDENVLGGMRHIRECDVGLKEVFSPSIYVGSIHSETVKDNKITIIDINWYSVCL